MKISPVVFHRAEIFSSAYDAIGEEESFERVQELRPTSAAPNSIEQFIHWVKKFLAHAELTSTALHDLENKA